jgi:hypothetical protein
MLEAAMQTTIITLRKQGRGKARRQAIGAPPVGAREPFTSIAANVYGACFDARPAMPRHSEPYKEEPF